jgi:sec-independent protein translocase protein TatA
MAGIGMPELLIIGAIVLVLLGPSRPAEVGGALGQSIRSFRAAVHAEGPPVKTGAEEKEQPHA